MASGHYIGPRPYERPRRPTASAGQTLYEVAEGRAHHDHLICDSCGFIIEFESDEIEALQDSAARRFGFNVLRHRHELFGLCEKARGIAGGSCPGEAAGRRSRS